MLNLNKLTRWQSKCQDRLILKVSHYPSTGLHTLFTNPSIHILLTHPATFKGFPFHRHSSLISNLSPRSPPFILRSSLFQIFLNIRHYSSFFSFSESSRRVSLPPPLFHFALISPAQSLLSAALPSLTLPSVSS